MGEDVCEGVVVFVNEGVVVGVIEGVVVDGSVQPNKEENISKPNIGNTILLVITDFPLPHYSLTSPRPRREPGR
jgi:hypothetical protein